MRPMSPYETGGVGPVSQPAVCPAGWESCPTTAQRLGGIGIPPYDSAMAPRRDGNPALRDRGVGQVSQPPFAADYSPRMLAIPQGSPSEIHSEP